MKKKEEKLLQEVAHLDHTHSPGQIIERWRNTFYNKIFIFFSPKFKITEPSQTATKSPRWDLYSLFFHLKFPSKSSLWFAVKVVIKTVDRQRKTRWKVFFDWSFSIIISIGVVSVVRIALDSQVQSGPALLLLLNSIWNIKIETSQTDGSLREEQIPKSYYYR